MPRYDYRCLNCDYEFELVQGFGEAGKGTCPRCSGVGRRLFHAVPVIYKGSGFYTTDYGRPKRAVENGAKDSSDTKPAAVEPSTSTPPAPSDGASSPDKSGSKTEAASAPAKGTSTPAKK